MPIRPFTEIPTTLRAWSRWCAETAVVLSTDNVSTAVIEDGAVTNAKLRDSTACSVVGRSANSTGDVADISASNDQFLVRRSNVLGFGALVDADIPATIARDAEVTSAISTALTNITSGTYTPTLTNTTNVAASTPRQATYLRVGNSVTVAGQVDIDPTGVGQTVLGLSLPVASAFTTAYQLGGVAACPAVLQSAAIFADSTNDRARLEWLTTDIANQTWTYTFTYQVI